MPSASRDARIAAALFVLALVPFVWFYGGAGWNQDAHFDLTRALVERGTLYIDGYEKNTGDVSTGTGGHVYINKAPGVSFLAAVPYAIVRGGESLLGIEPSEEVSRTDIRLVTAMACGVAGAAVGPVLFLFGRRRAGTAPAQAVLVAVAVLFGTIVFAYATLLMAHVPAALFLLLAFVLLPDRPMAAGVAAGVATTCFYVCAIAVPLLALIALRRSARSLLRFLAGGAPFAILLGLYHWACFGSPFRTAVESSAFFTEKGLLFGVLRAPQAEALREITIGPFRGLFFTSPVLLLGLAGIVFMMRRPGWRLTGAAIAIVTAGFILTIAGFNGWSGGWAFGPRYLLPVIPLLGLAMLFVPWTRPVAALLVLLASLSIAVNFIATATDTMPSPEVHDPVRDYLAPAFFSGKISEETRRAFPWYGSTRVEKVALPRDARNLGEPLVGEGRRTSAMPMLAWIVGGTAVLLLHARREVP